MKTKRLTGIPGLVLTAMFMLLVVPVLVYGDDPGHRSPGSPPGEDPIIGTWLLDAVGILPAGDLKTGVFAHNIGECIVDSPPGPPGQPPVLPVFKDLRTFTSDGELIATNGTFALRSAAHGIWQRTAPGRYSTTYSSYAYDVDESCTLPNGMGGTIPCDVPAVSGIIPLKIVPVVQRIVEEHIELDKKNPNKLTGTIYVRFCKVDLEFCSDADRNPANCLKDVTGNDVMPFEKVISKCQVAEDFAFAPACAHEVGQRLPFLPFEK